jgi:hypothetical protein
MSGTGSYGAGFKILWAFPTRYIGRRTAPSVSDELAGADRVAIDRHSELAVQESLGETREAHVRAEIPCSVDVALGTSFRCELSLLLPKVLTKFTSRFQIVSVSILILGKHCLVNHEGG